jgi:hypothetical protein
LIYPPAHGARIAANLRRERIEIHKVLKEIVGI